MQHQRRKLPPLPLSTPTPSVNSGGSTTYEETGRVSEQQMEQFFDDNTSGEKDTHGMNRLNAGKHGKHLPCGTEIVEKVDNSTGGNIYYCPNCRKQLYRGVDMTGDTNYQQWRDPGQAPMSAFQAPDPGSLKFDIGDYAGAGRKDGFEFN